MMPLCALGHETMVRGPAYLFALDDRMPECFLRIWHYARVVSSVRSEAGALVVKASIRIRLINHHGSSAFNNYSELKRGALRLSERLPR